VNLAQAIHTDGLVLIQHAFINAVAFNGHAEFTGCADFTDIH
jgi:hypothetical protein|tara:strand:+ start:176 stop:301 length:126 start_codon:yes stop_codon:yes gene_type:complete